MAVNSQYHEKISIQFACNPYDSPGFCPELEGQKE